MTKRIISALAAAASLSVALGPIPASPNESGAPKAAALPGIVRSKNNLFLMENHQVAHLVWHALGIRSATVVHVDAHDDCRLVPGEKTQKATALAEQGRWAELHSLSDMHEYFSYRRKQGEMLFELGNFLYPCIVDGTVAAIYWVVPNKTLDQTERARLKEHMRGALCLKTLPDFVDEGSNGFRFTISNAIFAVTTLQALPHLPPGCLLDIDTDFFAFSGVLTDDHLIGPFQWDPENVMQTLAERVPSPAVATISSSVWGGYLPLYLRFLSDAIFERLATGSWPGEARLFEKTVVALLSGRMDNMETALSAISQEWHAARNHLDGLASLMRGNAEEAAASFSKAAQREAVYSKAFLDAAETLLAMERIADAERMVEKFDACYGCRTTMADATRTRIAIRKRDFSMADDLTSRLLDWERTSHVLMLRGGLLTEIGRLDEAEAIYKEALARDPNKAIVHYNLGVLAEKRGKPEDALALFAVAIRALPSFADAHEHMGHILLLRGELEKAAGCFEQTLKSSPGRVTALNNLGLVLLRQRKFRDAIAQFEKALKINPSLAETHYNIGIAWTALGSNEKAIEHFNAALNLRPDFEQAKKALQQAQRNRE